MTKLYAVCAVVLTCPPRSPQLLDANRRLHDVLAQHEYGHWRSKLGDGLVSVTSRWNRGR